MIFLIPSFHWGSDYLLIQWAAGFAIAFLFYSLFLVDKLGRLPALTFAYLSLNAVYCFAFKQNRYDGNQNLQLYVAYGSMYLLIAMTMLSMISVNAKELTGMVCRAMPWYTLGNALYVDYGWLSDLKFIPELIRIRGRLPEGMGVSGYLDYSGLNSILLCAGVPFFIHELVRSKRWLGAIGLPLTLFAIYASISSIGYGVLAVAVSAYVCHRYQKMLWPALGSLSLLGFGYLTQGRAIFDDAYRFKAYKVFMGAWWEKANHWFGTGPGTFQVLGPLLQVEKGFMVDPTGKTHSFFWLWLHSDWLQTCFEAGYVGGALVLSTFLYGLKRLWGKEEEYSSAIFALSCALGAAAIFDYPVKYWSTAFLTAFALGAAYI